jgi:hypothetical protein
MLYRPGKRKRVFGTSLPGVSKAKLFPFILSLPAEKGFPSVQPKHPDLLSMETIEEAVLPKLVGKSKEEILYNVQIETFKNIQEEVNVLKKIKNLLIFVATSMASGALDRVYSKTITTSTTEIVEKSRKIRAIYIFNNDTSGANVVYISPDSTVTVNDGFPIIPGDRFEHILLPDKSLYAVGDGDTEVRIAEMTVVGIPSGKI